MANELIPTKKSLFSETGKSERPFIRANKYQILHKNWKKFQLIGNFIFMSEMMPFSMYTGRIFSRSNGSFLTNISADIIQHVPPSNKVFGALILPADSKPANPKICLQWIIEDRGCCCV
jgi:hypothetical protein